jgi:hypothetical protein
VRVKNANNGSYEKPDVCFAASWAPQIQKGYPMTSSVSPESDASSKPMSQEVAAAKFLIDSGFRPEANGMVRHVVTGGLGRTIGSVWRAMRLLLDGVDQDSTA